MSEILSAPVAPLALPGSMSYDEKNDVVVIDELVPVSLIVPDPVRSYATCELRPAEETLTARGLRPRHIQLIAISGAIGAGVFISIGGPMTSAGPLGLLIGVGIWSFVIWVGRRS